MKKSLLTKLKKLQFPVIVEKDEDGFYIVECPLFKGCYTQGKSLDSVLKNIREVIQLCLEEKENQEIVTSYRSEELSLHTISLNRV